MDSSSSSQRPLHAIVIPFPGPGHLTPTFQLALKLLQGPTPFTHITFINTVFNHRLIEANGHSHDLFAVPGLKLLSVADGLPPDHGRLNDGRIPEFADAIDAMNEVFAKLIQDLVSEAASSSSVPPVSCIIADIYYYWMSDIADAAGLPLAAFWTTPAHANLAYFFMSDLLAQGIIPINRTSSEATERLVRCMPGVPSLRACDLPSSFLTLDGSQDDHCFQWTLRRYRAGRPQRARWHLVNATYMLDQKSMDAFQECMGGGGSWPVGPMLPPQFFSREMHSAPAMSTGLWAESPGCKEWLEDQQDGSVLYISFGSIVHFEPQQIEELAAGVEASGRPFLWVLRMDVDPSSHAKLEEFKKRTSDRGLFVSWAPQLLVLSHRSVGAFLTHCGWNSIMEAISGGIPMLAWPGEFAEQPMNAKYIVDVWKIALSFKKERSEEGLLVVKKEEVERMIVKVLSAGSENVRALRKRSRELQEIIRDAVLSAEGSSQANLTQFVQAVAQHKPIS